MNSKNCRNCKKAELIPFYRVEGVPVHSVLLMDSKQEALNYPKRNIELGFCPQCGFISNTIFDARVIEYSSKYEETQGFSGTFNKFQDALAERLVQKYRLYNKNLLEIGCGKGEFITLLCEKGNNRGYGFDPAFVPERNPDKNHRVRFIADYYSEQYAHYKADFIGCKMTLEHIPNTYDFLKMVSNAIGETHRPIVFFQIPETTKILRNLGFWDIYYEHCSYFSRFSLAYLFKATGFEILSLDTSFDDQYLMIEAKPVRKGKSPAKISPAYENRTLLAVKYFKDRIRVYLDQWKSLIACFHRQGKKIILWGGSSKSVAFLTTLGITDEIEYVVDINPYKHGTYLPGNGQKIIAPDQLADYKPDLVIVMNPIYVKEIKEEMAKTDLSPDILPVDRPFRKKTADRN